MNHGGLGLLGLIKLEDAQRIRRKGFKKRAAHDAVKVRFASDLPGGMFPPRLRPLDNVFVEDTTGVFPDAEAVAVAQAMASVSSKGTLRTPTTEPPIVLRISPSRQMLPALTMARTFPFTTHPSSSSVGATAPGSVRSGHSSGADSSPSSLALENLFLWGDCFATSLPSSNVSVGSSWRTRQSKNSQGSAAQPPHGRPRNRDRDRDRGGRPRGRGGGGQARRPGSPTSTITTVDNAMDMDEANADLYDDSVLPMGVAAAAEEEEAPGKNDGSNISSNGRGSRGAVGTTSEREWDDAELRDGDDGASALLDPSASLLASFRICLHARSPPDFFRDPTQARGAAAAPARLPHLIAVQWYTLQSVHHPETDPDRLTLRLLTTGKTPQLKAERTLDIRAAKMVIKKTTEVDPISIDQIAIIEKFR